MQPVSTGRWEKVSLTPRLITTGLSPPAVVRATSGSHSRLSLNAGSVPRPPEKLIEAVILSQRLSRTGVMNIEALRGQTKAARGELQFLQVLPDRRLAPCNSDKRKAREHHFGWGIARRAARCTFRTDERYNECPATVAPRLKVGRTFRLRGPASPHFAEDDWRTSRQCHPSIWAFDPVSVTRLPRWPVRS